MMPFSALHTETLTWSSACSVLGFHQRTQVWVEIPAAPGILGCLRHSLQGHPGPHRSYISEAQPSQAGSSVIWSSSLKPGLEPPPNTMHILTFQPLLQFPGDDKASPKWRPEKKSHNQDQCVIALSIALQSYSQENTVSFPALCCKTLLTDTSATTLFELYLSKARITHLLSGLEWNKKFLSSSVPLPPSLLRVSQPVRNCYASALKVPFQHFFHSRGLFQPALGILPTDISATST